MKIIKKLNSILSFKVNVANILGALGFFLSIYSIRLSKAEHNMRVEEFEASQIPVWDLQFTYSNNNLDLISAQFNVRNNEKIILNGFSIYCPTDMGDSFEVNIEGNTWLCYSFFEKVNEKLREYIKLPETDIVFEGYLNKEVSYPIAIKFDYFFGQKKKAYIDVYLIHLVYYTKEKFRVKGWELIEKIPDKRLAEVKPLLNKLNKEKGLLYELKMANEFDEEYIFLYNFISTINKYKKFSASVNNQLNASENYAYSVEIPSLYCDSNTSEILSSYWEQLNANMKKYPISIQEDLRKLKEFVNLHPPKSSQYIGGRNDIWVKDTSMIKEWNAILEDLMTNFNTQIQ